MYRCYNDDYPRHINKTFRNDSSRRYRKIVSTCRKTWKPTSIVCCRMQLSGINLVTREEFDVQTALLVRTREKLEKLEKLLDELKKIS